MKYYIGLHIVFCSFIVIAMGCNDKIRKPALSPTKIAMTSAVNQHLFPNPYQPIDVSPMDMSYFPADYPQKKLSKLPIREPVMRIIYSRPHLQGRKLFHEVLKYGEYWRLGANEATELDIFKTVFVGGKKLIAGRYTLYCIPYKNEWNVIINNNKDVWGLRPDSTKDVLHVMAQVSIHNASAEYFTMIFQKTNKGADLLMIWDNILARLPFSFS